jgi:hypothetical protein
MRMIVASLPVREFKSDPSPKFRSEISEAHIWLRAYFIFGELMLKTKYWSRAAYYSEIVRY